MLTVALRAPGAVFFQPEHVDLMNGKLMAREGIGAKDWMLWIGSELLEEPRDWMDRRPESDYLLPTKKGR